MGEGNRGIVDEIQEKKEKKKIVIENEREEIKLKEIEEGIIKEIMEKDEGKEIRREIRVIKEQEERIEIVKGKE